MPSIESPDEELRWTVRVVGDPGSVAAPALIVHARNLMPLVARLLADARVQDVVVRPRIREVRTHVIEPANARRGA